MIGLRATELVAEATLALSLNRQEELVRTIHAHPTMAEAVGKRPMPSTGRYTFVKLDM